MKPFSNYIIAAVLSLTAVPSMAQQFGPIQYGSTVPEILLQYYNVEAAPGVGSQGATFQGQNATVLEGFQQVSLASTGNFYGVLNFNGTTHPNMNLLIGGNINYPSVLTVSNGTTELNRLYVGRFINGQFAADLNIFIDAGDTLRVNGFVVAEGGNVTIHGPGVLDVREEGHNAGYLKIEEPQALVFSADTGAWRQPFFENVGSVVGDFWYEDLELVRARFMNWDYVGAWYDEPTVIDSLSMIYNATWLEYYEDWWEEVQLEHDTSENVQNWEAFIEYALDSFATGMSGTFAEMHGNALKGIRETPFDNDQYRTAFFRRQDAYRYDHEAITGNEDIMASFTNLFDDFAVSDYDEDAPYYAVDGAPSIWISLTFSGTTVDGVTMSHVYNTPDTLVFNGQEAWIAYDYLLDGDTILFDSLVLNQESDPIFTLNVGAGGAERHIFKEYGGTYSDWNENGITGEWLDTARRETWYWEPDEHENFEDLHYGHVWMTPSFGGSALWHDVRAYGLNGNRLWESQNHYVVVDTVRGEIPWPLGLHNYLGGNNIIATFGELTSPETAPGWAWEYQSEYPDSHPIGGIATTTGLAYGANGSGWLTDNIQYNKAAFCRMDMTTPQPFPYGYWKQFHWMHKAPHILKMRGTPWMNSIAAYDDMPYHEQWDESDLIPNLPPYPPLDHGIEFYLPTAPDWEYVYAPSGDLFTVQDFNQCLQGNDTAFCLNVDQNGLPVYTLFDASGIDATNVYFDDEIDLGTITTNATANQWIMITNPTLGMLDLDLVAEKYFELNPSSDHLEFAWMHRDACSGWGPLNPANVSECAKSFWRRKYHRYFDQNGNETIINSELEYWLGLLAQQFLNGEPLSPQGTEIAIAFLDGEIGPDDEAVMNWLMSANINPNKYVEMGRFVSPGNAFYARNSASSNNQLLVTSDMAHYNYDFYDTTMTEIYVGSNTPLDGGIFPGRMAEGASMASTIEYPNTLILCYNHINDSTFMPALFLNHQFRLDAENGSTQLLEDEQASFAGYPCVYTDSMSFRPSNHVIEYGPHNQSAMWFHMPEPEPDGAWIFEPIQFQNVGDGDWWDEITEFNYTRFAFELYENDGTEATQIIYLDQGETWQLNHGDYQWPLEGKMYFTTLIGDINGDGAVTNQDFLGFLQHWLTCDPDWADNAFWSDLNGDGCVTTTDLILLITNFGEGLFDEDGTWQDDNIFDGPELPEVEQDALKAVWRNYYPHVSESAQMVTGNMIQAFGEVLTVYDSNLDVVASGRNTVNVPRAGTYLVVGDKTTMGYFIYDTFVDEDVDVDTSVYTEADGAAVAEYVAKAAASGDANQWWIDFYTDVLHFSGEADSWVQSPRLNQIYYGLNSAVGGSASADVFDPNNAKWDGLIDMFGTGAIVDTALNSYGGAMNDIHWNGTAEAYESIYRASQAGGIFRPTEVPMAFVLPHEQVNYNLNKISPVWTDQAIQKYDYGVTNFFGSNSEVGYDRAERTPYDALIHNGALAMADFMPLDVYFRMKMHGVSPKFGVQDAFIMPADPSRDAFGTEYNLHAVTQEAQHSPAKSWAPSLCSNWDAWTDNIMVPFFTAFSGQPATPAIITHTAQNGAVTNNNPNHYEWFTQAPCFTIHGSYGPLIYDFNMDGVWTADDLAIWNGMVAEWETDATLNVPDVAVYTPANYYRPATEAADVVLNTVPNYTADDVAFGSSRWFYTWFRIKDQDYQFIKDDLFNWHNCLDQLAYQDNRVYGAFRAAPMFQDNPSYAWMQNGTNDGFNMTLVNSPTVAPSGYVESGTHIGTDAGWNQHPDNSFFPVSLFWN